jgi:hypothetical protein
MVDFKAVFAIVVAEEVILLPSLETLDATKRKTAHNS